MGAILLKWAISAVLVFIVAYLMPTVKLNGYFTALVVVLVLGVINIFVKPLLTFLTLPITVLTFGLFIFVINALMIMLTSAIVPGFNSGGFWSSLLFSVILSILNMFFYKFL